MFFLVSDKSDPCAVGPAAQVLLQAAGRQHARRARPPQHPGAPAPDRPQERIRRAARMRARPAQSRQGLQAHDPDQVDGVLPGAGGVRGQAPAGDQQAEGTPSEPR